MLRFMQENKRKSSSTFTNQPLIFNKSVRYKYFLLQKQKLGLLPHAHASLLARSLNFLQRPIHQLLQLRIFFLAAFVLQVYRK